MMYPWTKRPPIKVKEKFPGLNLWRYRGKAQSVFFGMIILMMLLILYRMAANETDSPKIMGTKKLMALEKMKKRTMENINEVMAITQPSDHLAWQKEYEAKIISAAKQGGPGFSHRQPNSVNSAKDNYIAVEEHKYPPLFRGMKLVHLDLKGAPPKISYFQEIFPLIHNLGGTGILIEYEDMFPYRHSQITARNAYTKDDIEQILQLASENDLDVIPLIQTFGHLEFVLKSKKYKHLREVPHYPQVVCPTHNSTFILVQEMIDDIISLHPTSRYIHIGCDEVYNLGECSRCLDTMVRERWTKKNLFLHHVTKVARYIRKKYPNMVVLTWDDEFRQLTLEELISAEVGKLLEPVVWKYTPEIETQLPFALWEKYASVFPAVWIASAFKGATGPEKYVTDISYHLENHRSWMKLVSMYSHHIVFRGIFLTGWQRYDHFAILCELLPVGLPSLFVNLAYMSSNQIETSAPPEKAVAMLKCESTIGLMRATTVIHCMFPGSPVYECALRLSVLNEGIQKMMDDSTYRGWFTEYNIQMLFSSRSHDFDDIRQELAEVY